MTRRFDLAKVVAAYVAQVRLTASWLEDQDLTVPSVLPAWTRAEVVDHVCRSGRQVVELAPGRTTEAPLSIGDYTSAYAAAADEIAERSRGKAMLDLAAMADEFEAFFATQTEHVVPAPRGPIRLSDLVATRVLEVVAHSLDLDVEAPMHREALATVVRLLAGALAERHPGRAVELRVPPFVAVQLLEGTTHRRGTPPAVVETDPVTWIRLAVGRIGWAEAPVWASGERSDLSGILPVLS